MAKDTIFFPSFIGSADFSPARVLPRIFFYNGLKECEDYYITSGSDAEEFGAFPHFDHYSGAESTTGSLSLLFQNEAASYGTAPTASLYNTYWENYVDMLYNPRTRLLTAKAVIPLAFYFDMELNDKVNFRGATWMLRAINAYSLTTGECEIQLLGPVPEFIFEANSPRPIPPGELPDIPSPLEPLL